MVEEREEREMGMILGSIKHSQVACDISHDIIAYVT